MRGLNRAAAQRRLAAAEKERAASGRGSWINTMVRVLAAPRVDPLDELLVLASPMARRLHPGPCPADDARRPHGVARGLWQARARQYLMAREIDCARQEGSDPRAAAMRVLPPVEIGIVGGRIGRITPLCGEASPSATRAGRERAGDAPPAPKALPMLPEDQEGFLTRLYEDGDAKVQRLLARERAAGRLPPAAP